MKRTLGNTRYEVYPVAFSGYVCVRDGQAASDRYLSWALDHGVNYVDISPDYEDAEEKLGNSLRGHRNEVYLACKTNRRLRKEAEKDFERSLRELHTDYFDVYQLHALASVSEVETAFGPGGVMEMLVKIKEQGYARKLGITCHSEKAALRALELYPFDTLLFPLNWHMNLFHGMGNKLLRVAKERNMGILAMKQLIDRAWADGDDALRNHFPKSWLKPIDPENTALRLAAIKYAYSLGADILTPPGDFENYSFVVEHAEECLKNPLNEDDLALLRSNYDRVIPHPLFPISEIAEPIGKS